METMLDNLINGNLKDALERAKKFHHGPIYFFLRNSMGWSEKRAKACADYLKGRGSFQAYCDADQKKD